MHVSLLRELKDLCSYCTVGIVLYWSMISSLLNMCFYILELTVMYFSLSGQLAVKYTPAHVFFFNSSWESHDYLKAKLREQKSVPPPIVSQAFICFHTAAFFQVQLLWARYPKQLTTHSQYHHYVIQFNTKVYICMRTWKLFQNKTLVSILVALFKTQRLLTIHSSCQHSCLMKPSVRTKKSVLFFLICYSYTWSEYNVPGIIWKEMDSITTDIICFC